MAHPLFSGENPGRAPGSDTLTVYEIYHAFMQAYPAYTVERIETELSWRMVKKLMDCWEKRTPGSLRIERIEKMLELKFNLKVVSSKPSDTDLLNNLAGMGWI